MALVPWFGCYSISTGIVLLPSMSMVCLNVMDTRIIVRDMQFVPESARFHVVKGQNLKAEKVLRRVALYNFKQPLVVGI